MDGAAASEFLTLELLAVVLFAVIAAFAGNVVSVRSRLVQIETSMRTSAETAPTKDDLHDLSLKVKGLSGQLSTHEEADRGLGRSIDEVRDRLTGLEKLVQRIDDHLRRSGQ